MENVTKKRENVRELIQGIGREIFIEIQSARSLIEAGKEIQCGRKLQGISAKYEYFIQQLEKTSPSEDEIEVNELAKTNSEE